MAPQDFASAASPIAAENGTVARYGILSSWRAGTQPRHRYWLHGLLFLLTLLSTTVVGARMQYNFAHNLPFFNVSDIESFTQWTNPRSILMGLPFSLTLLAILLAHEFGHYVACVHYGVNASLPYFLPAPTFIGTFGAFIRIRSPIYSKRVLFDIGVAGPIAGFVVLLPALATGLAFSKVVPGIAHQGTLQFGTPALLWFLQHAIFPGVASADIYLHPVARAAWVGIFATALNLLPIGQLDGGHILYSIVGEKHKALSRVFIAVLIPIGILFWHGWLLWAFVLFFFGMRHPFVYDLSSLGSGRTQLAWLALGVFLLCFTFAPVSAIGRF